MAGSMLVAAYDPEWPRHFEEIRGRLASSLSRPWATAMQATRAYQAGRPSGAFPVWTPSLTTYPTISTSATRLEYARIKRAILAEHGQDKRQAYVEAKEGGYRWFFEKVLALAETELKHRI